jgi:hypothetical protein
VFTVCGQALQYSNHKQVAAKNKLKHYAGLHNQISSYTFRSHSTTCSPWSSSTHTAASLPTQRSSRCQRYTPVGIPHPLSLHRARRSLNPPSHLLAHMLYQHKYFQRNSSPPPSNSPPPTNPGSTYSPFPRCGITSSASVEASTRAISATISSARYSPTRILRL